MACGVPVVTSTSSSLPEVVRDAAVCVDPLSHEAIAEAIQAVLSSKALRSDLREKGLQRAKQFSWERTARETLRVYEDVAR
jgi:glycosyltransferase involved in cell wall biosynthesis